MLHVFSMSPGLPSGSTAPEMKPSGFGCIPHGASEVFPEIGVELGARAAARGAWFGWMRRRALKRGYGGISVNGVFPGRSPAERQVDTPAEANERFPSTTPGRPLERSGETAAETACFASDAAGSAAERRRLVSGGHEEW